MGLDDESEWAFELKWDGIRAVAVIDAAGDASLWSRNGNDLSISYPELLPELARATSSMDGAVLDEEIVAPDPSGRPSFSLLQTRMGLPPNATWSARRTVPVQFITFDLLEVGGASLVDASYDRRRKQLETRVHPNKKVLVPAAMTSGLDGLGSALSTGSGRHRETAGGAYRVGRRSADWLKFKHHFSQEVVVGGWRPGSRR